MYFTFLNWISEHSPKADKSAVAAINRALRMSGAFCEILLYVQLFNLACVFSQEGAAGLRVLIFHQFRHQSRCQHSILYGHALEGATGRIKDGFTQFLRIHLTQAFETLELQSFSVWMGLDELLPRLIVQQPGNFTLVLDRIERRAGNVDMTLLDQFTKLLVEKGKQQALDMQSIHIGVGGDDHTIELEATDIKEIARPGTKYIYNRPD